MQDFVVFTPRILTFGCPTCVEEIRKQECLSEGKYCLIPPKDDIMERYNWVKDRQLLLESIRTRCVYKLVDNKQFFNYLYNQRLECVEERSRLNNRCSDRAMKNIGIDAEKVE